VRAVALAAAVLAAVVLPGGPPGIGFPLVGLAVAATVVATAPQSRDLAFFGAAALTLTAFAAVLDARWVVLVDLVAAWIFATVAVAGPKLVAPLAPFAVIPRMPALLPESSSRAQPALRGVGIGATLVTPFAVLFLTADAAFAAIADNTPRPELGSLPARLLAFGVVLLAALGLALAAGRDWAARPLVRRRRLAPVEWVLPLVALNALFATFVAVQVTVLFAGHDHVLRTSGLTYAEYARSGFWQLLAAAVLTLAVIKGATLAAAPRTRAEQLLLQLLLGLLCALTLVIVASAFHRLRLYESAFGLTRLRLTAEAFSLWLGGTFALLVVLGALRRAAAFPRVVLAWSAVALIVFSLANPEARIAERNVDHWRETGRIDLDYASGLSADAVPALSGLPSPLRDEALARLRDELARHEPWSSANLSRRDARRLLASAPSSNAAELLGREHQARVRTPTSQGQ
jgi:hypothetical protein